MSRFDLYDVTFQWSDESETFHSYRADNFHAALAEATDDDDAMSPENEGAELLTVRIHNNSAACRQRDCEEDEDADPRTD
jgi:hypothetical protein